MFPGQQLETHNFSFILYLPKYLNLTPINVLQYAYYIIYEKSTRYFWYLGNDANEDRKNMNIRTQSDVFNFIL